VPFRRRLALAAAAAVAGAVLLASVAAYVLVRGQLRGEIDESLQARAAGITDMGRLVHGPGFGPPRRIPPPEFEVGGPVPFVQLLGENGQVIARGGEQVRLPVEARDIRSARGEDETALRDAQVDGQHVRMLTASMPGGGAIQIARSLDEVDQVLGDLRLILAGVLLLGIAFALVLGRFVARTALGPVERLTEASEHVAATKDLSRRIDGGGGDDELGRLADSFNTMLDALEGTMAALDSSLHAQRQLVADASHELRTPLTSLRTNIEVLRDPDGLSPAQRRELLDDVAAQLDELGGLVGDLIEIARGEDRRLEPQDVRLDELVAEVVDRRRRYSRDLRFETELEPTVVEGAPERLERAVANLLDNAAKFSPPGGVVEIALERSELSVRDHGPGIDPVDLPHVFDRFYRSAAARAVPGSGLGLAIVRQTAEAHGGDINVEPAEGGGTVFRLRLPGQRLGEEAVGLAKHPENRERSDHLSSLPLH
jgi:two-component system, OmpR family, sensor histidine kinase MprB